MSLDFSVYAMKETEVIWKNITGNVAPMWDKAGIYDDLYNSDGKRAEDVICNLQAGLQRMKDDPMEYEKLNPENSWGSYSGAIEWLEELISEMEQCPNGIISISK